MVRVDGYLGEGVNRTVLPYVFPSQEDAIKYLVKAAAAANEKGIPFTFEFLDKGKTK